MTQKRILIVFGTRPEAIKMAPLIKNILPRKEAFDVRVCITAQHRTMLDQVIEFFEIPVHYDLDIMKANQTLYDITASVLLGLQPIMADFKPDYVFVHGDTTTSTAASLAAFYAGAKIAHVEAGLRTFNKFVPFPEEMNRQLTGRLADIHFAPTAGARENLLRENIPDSSIYVTGNTVIDALHIAIKNLATYTDSEIMMLKELVKHDDKIILVTGHRRENFGKGFLDICKALHLISQIKGVQIVYPVHLNPNVRGPVYDQLKDISNIHLIEPLGYPAFVWLMNNSHLVITDSGGVQEEAPSLGKPVLVMRDTTERPEAIAAGTAVLTGTDSKRIFEKTKELIENEAIYNAMSMAHNPYGDGKSTERIIDIINRL